jgi:4-(2-carboxyphenyl)-2-oxobut-3-enoate aldolase
MARGPNFRGADLKGVFGLMHTPLKATATDNNATDVVNVDEAARAADALVRDGVCALLINSTFGEVPSLLWEEAQTFTAAVVDSVRHRVPVFAGVTTLNTRESIMRAKRYRDIGAEGILAGRPMMAPLSDPNVVQHYSDLAAAVPEMALCLYETPEVFRRPITTAAFEQLVKVPNIVACKYRSKLIMGVLSKNTFEADIEACGNNIKLLPMEADWLFTYRTFDCDACWSSFAMCGPAPIMALRDALYAQNWQHARDISKDLAWGLEGMIPNNDFQLWFEDKIPFMKARFNAAGYFNSGPTLPPYQYISPKRLELAKELGRRGHALQVKYSQRAAAAA